jgi:hypothetical protein
VISSREREEEIPERLFYQRVQKKAILLSLQYPSVFFCQWISYAADVTELPGCHENFTLLLDSMST